MRAHAVLGESNHVLKEATHIKFHFTFQTFKKMLLFSVCTCVLYIGRQKISIALVHFFGEKDYVALN